MGELTLEQHRLSTATQATTHPSRWLGRVLLYAGFILLTAIFCASACDNFARPFSWTSVRPFAEWMEQVSAAAAGKITAIATMAAKTDSFFIRAPENNG